MPHLSIRAVAFKAHTYLFISVALLVTLGGALLLMQSGAIDALNRSGLLAEQWVAP